MSNPAPGDQKRFRLKRVLTVPLVPAIAMATALAGVSPAAAQVERPDRPLRTLPDAPIEHALGRDSDVRFMTAMLAHHRQGLEMIKLAADRAVRPGLRVLVARIASNYEDESTMIRLWLRDRQERLSTLFERAALVDEHPSTISDLPGILAHQLMEALRHATGPDFDERFLRLAILHHAVGMELVDSLLADPAGARDDTVFRIVEGFQGEQSAYIGHMRRMLDEAAFRKEQD